MLNTAVLFRRRPFPLRKLHLKVEIAAEDPAENKKQHIAEPQPPPDAVSPPG